MRERQEEVARILFRLFGHDQFLVQDIGRRSQEDREHIAQMLPRAPRPDHTINNDIGSFLTEMNQDRFEVDSGLNVTLEVTRHSSHNYYRFI